MSAPPDSVSANCCHPKIRTIFATSHKKPLSGLPASQSIHCRRGRCQIIAIREDVFARLLV
jgi:hypothetical protein